MYKPKAKLPARDEENWGRGLGHSMVITLLTTCLSRPSGSYAHTIPLESKLERKNTSGRVSGRGEQTTTGHTQTPWGGRGAAKKAGGEGEGVSSEFRSPGKAGHRGPVGREGSILSKPTG